MDWGVKKSHVRATRETVSRKIGVRGEGKGGGTRGSHHAGHKGVRAKKDLREGEKDEARRKTERENDWLGYFTGRSNYGFGVFRC